MLEVRDLQTSYGRSQVLFGIDLKIGTKEVVSLLGRNGMGKTTTVRSIMGITPAKAGTIVFQGREIQRLPSYKVAKAGLGLVPEGRQVFPNLTVRENLVATARKGTWDEERVFKLFPHLEHRKGNYGNQLSGGEQQMLAIARALLTNPRVMLCDEPSEGLAPRIVEEVGATLQSLKGEGLSVLLVEQNARLALSLADRVAILNTGRLAFEGSVAEVSAHPEVLRRHLGVH
jgi:branched-chain amino acid transport system ATP-binding protein